MTYTYDNSTMTLTLMVDGKSYSTKANEFNLQIKKQELYERYINDSSTI